MGGKERMNSISALKVAVSENLVYGLIFLPLWFRNKDGGSLRVALWLSRMLVSTTLGIVITNGFRNGDIPSYARCACINGRALASMQYSSPPFVQPSCNSSDGNATSLWRVCDDVGDFGGSELSNETMRGCNYVDDVGSGEFSDPRPLFLNASNTRTHCWRCTEACCGAYLNARQAANEERLTEVLSGFGMDASEMATDFTDPYFLETGCEPPERSWLVESLVTAFARWFMLEPVSKVIAYGKYCCKPVPMKLRLLLLLPWTAYTMYFAVVLSRINAVYQESLGTSDDDLGVQSSIITSLLLNMLLYDLLKEFAKAKATMSKDDLDEDGLPMIEMGQSKRVVEV